MAVIDVGDGIEGGRDVIHGTKGKNVSGICMIGNTHLFTSRDPPRLRPVPILAVVVMVVGQRWGCLLSSTTIGMLASVLGIDRCQRWCLLLLSLSSTTLELSW